SPALVEEPRRLLVINNSCRIASLSFLDSPRSRASRDLAGQALSRRMAEDDGERGGAIMLIGPVFIESFFPWSENKGCERCRSRPHQRIQSSQAFSPASP